jgi:hypothetical protein
VAAGDIPTGWLSTDTKAPGGVVRMVRRRRRHPEVATIRNKTIINLPMKVVGRDFGDRLTSSETCIKSSHAVRLSESHLHY